MRRIVTGHDAAGKAIFIEDGEAPKRITLAGRPGWALNTLWATGAEPATAWCRTARAIAGRTALTSPARWRR